MTGVKEIKAPISAEMDEFEHRFRASMRSNTPLLDRITHYIVKRKGKQMRPMFVFLSAKMCGGINDSTYVAASLIELLHTATLVHDDVVDDANLRRGFFSINALWKNKIAVLVGDFLLSRGLLMSVDEGEFELLKIVSNAVKEMSEGELMQMEKARKLDITEEVYFEIIRQKTASLIAACCQSGAHSSKTDPESQERMRLFGEKTGIAFQIKDDLFDYNTNGKIGKPTGIDIKEKKMTLPLIYALAKAEKRDRKWLINSVKNHHEDKNRVAKVIDYVMGSGGIEYARDKMLAYRDEALEILHTFEEGEARNSLEALVNYTIERKK
ncbi:MAG TPA: polyprenyl synthetase family protein [Cryomorphaceae bacterium]|nr:polyprenyl synthetase family protein [Cryomorphaceae bacterium]